jgi:energy-coupling factor transporter ATP-binding protein EcfA2
MRLVSLDIDPQNRSNRIHLGPFVAGLNAVWGNRGSGKSTIAKFIRGLLYHRHRDAAGYGQDAVDGLVGSMQWADEAGATRVVSSADAVYDRDYRFEGPYFYEKRNAPLSNAAYPHAVPTEQPWQRIGGEIFDAVFCGRLGEVIPERLWAAARELGIHVSTGHEHDETYRRLKAEEARLQQRLHHLRVDDRDRAWWATERERLAARLNEVAFLPANLNTPSVTASQSSASSPSAAQLRDWGSQRVQLEAERSELLAREADLLRKFSNRRETAPFAVESTDDVPSNGRYSRSSTVYRDPFGTWTGYSKPARDYRDGAWQATGRDNPFPAEKIDGDLSAVRHRLAQVHLLLDELDGKLKQKPAPAPQVVAAWEGDDLRARLGYAEEVLKSWDLYEQTRRRLAEIQNQLRGFGPYHEAFRGSFIQCVERYIRELSAGALRQLPTWALEALRRDQGYAAGLSTNRGKLESYREVYRDYRPDTNRIDHPVPPSQSSERQLVELAIRMAILDSAAHRIGRIPLILDDALDGFNGQTLDHVVRVLIEFAREGQQVLLMTTEEEVAERVRVHHGWVSYLNHGLAEVDTHVVKPRLYREPSPDQVVLSRGPLVAEYSTNLADINAQLAGAEERTWDTVAAAPTWAEVETRYVPTVVPNGQFYLTESSPIEQAPGLQAELGQLVRRLGIQNIRQWISADPGHLAQRLGNQWSNVAMIARRQAEARLMCGVPQLRAFDARVLAGCGFQYPGELTATQPGKLLRRVEQFLSTPEGQDIMRTANSYELSRITGWINTARNRFQSSQSSDRDGDSRSRRRDRSARRERRPEYVRVSRETLTTPREERTTRRVVETGSSTLRFYLDPSSPVVDAPSIGPRMAERLSPLGVQIVQDLLEADPSRLAEQLNDKRITSATISEWQNQAVLVCRIPNLRGHDSQMLVACGITSPEQLVQANASSLYAKVAAFASSKAGVRLLRGSEGADLNEVQEWIAWAGQSRRLRAA